jgi:hypothetical protein
MSNTPISIPKHLTLSLLGEADKRFAQVQSARRNQVRLALGDGVLVDIETNDVDLHSGDKIFFDHDGHQVSIEKAVMSDTRNANRSGSNAAPKLSNF